MCEILLIKLKNKLWSYGSMEILDVGNNTNGRKVRKGSV